MPVSSNQKQRKRIAPTAVVANATTTPNSTATRSRRSGGSSKPSAPSPASRKRQKVGRVICFDSESSDSEEDDFCITILPSCKKKSATTTTTTNSPSTTTAAAVMPSSPAAPGTPLSLHRKKNSRSADDELDNASTGKTSAVSNEQEDASSDDVEIGDDLLGMEDDDDDDDQHDLPPTTQELSCLCWKCHVTLKMPSPGSNNNGHGGSTPTSASSSATPQQQSVFCLYAMHVHPLLSVPICSFCNEEVAKSYSNIAAESSNDNDDDVCHACASTSTTLFLCDTPTCDKAFCNTCVAQANGGGALGVRHVRRLLRDDDGEPWKCPACEPPTALRALQKELDPSTTTTSNTAAATLAAASLSQNDDDQQQPQQQRPIDEILKELDMVEAEMQVTQQLWDDPAAIQDKRAEVQAEIQEAKPRLSSAKLEALVNEELEAWKDLCTQHDHRLGDMASSLQEELEVAHNVDLAMVYKTILADGSSNQREGKDDDNEEEEPAWKRAADEEISKRHLAEPHNTILPILAPEMYLKEVFVDVEDLMTKPEDERDCPGNGFRSTMDRPTLEQIEDAMRAEDEVLAEKNVCIHHKFDSAMDLETTRTEEQETSQQGSGGVSRVRRDASFVTQLEVRSKKKKAPPPQPHLEDKESAEESAEESGVVVATAAHAAQQESKPEAAPLPARMPVSDVVDLTDDSPIVDRKPKRPFTAGLKNEFPKRAEKSKSTSGKSNEFDEEYYCPTDKKYRDSDLVLSSPETNVSGDGKKVKKICVSAELAKHLKPHQREGVKFMWKNACVDFNVRTSKEEEVHEEKEVGGCVLAHSMGLGKSLSTIALIETLLNHPSLVDDKGKGLARTTMLIVPVNTIASWKVEFDKWTRRLEPSILIYNLQSCPKDFRSSVISQWFDRGGVLLLSKDSFSIYAKQHPTLQSPGPDLLVLDEAHLMLSNRTNVIYKSLAGIKTKRRLLLTGSPFQNNALEYYRMIHYIRKDILDKKESSFEREFAIPINKGMPSDASAADLLECELKSNQLKNILSPYVHRKDSAVLRETLPPMQQVILHVRQTKMQTKLYTALKRFESRNDITSYLKRYSMARPVHNHPGCLLMKSSNAASGGSEDSDEELTGAISSKPWWQKVVDKVGVECFRSVEQGSKVVLLLHILTHADQIDDKVVVFSQCLKTLDFIEEVLQLGCWADHVPSLADSFPGKKLGGWSNGTDYLRIDGSDSAEQRGVLIKKFNRTDGEASKRVRVFLISSKAGGIGITLTAANRVVCFDSHFNPTIMNQSICRVYRYGQEKPVFAYRFLTEGTGEEKIYSRSVNKTGLSMRVIDGKNFKGSFTDQELSNLVLNDTWVQCETCEKWRMLFVADEDDLPDKWYCKLNKHDVVNNTCEASEKKNAWYHRHFRLARVDLSGNGTDKQEEISKDSDLNEDDEAAKAISEAKKETLVKNDAILAKLLRAADSGKSATGALVSKYYFHEALLEECEEDVADSKNAQGKEDDDSSNGEKDSKPAAVARVSDATVGDCDSESGGRDSAKGKRSRGNSDGSCQSSSQKRTPAKKSPSQKQFKRSPSDPDPQEDEKGAAQSKVARRSSSEGRPQKQHKKETPNRSSKQHRRNRPKVDPEIIELSSDEE